MKYYRISVWCVAVVYAVIGLVVWLYAGPPYTYTVKVPALDLTFTNVINYPTNCTPACRLVRWVENGHTNEFHAWITPIQVITNK